MLEANICTSILAKCLSDPEHAPEIVKNSKRCILNADFEILLSSTIDRCGSAAAAARVANHTSWRRLWDIALDHGVKGTRAMQAIFRELCRPSSDSSVHYVTLQFPPLVHAWNMCVPTIQAKWRTFPMTISYHSSLMQTQPLLFYQFVDVYRAVAAFGLSNIILSPCVFSSYCYVYVHTVHIYTLWVIAITISFH